MPRPSKPILRLTLSCGRAGSQYAEQREELRAAFARLAEQPIPARLCIVRLMAGQRRQHHRQVARIAAAVALLIVGGIGGWGAHDRLFFHPRNCR